MVMGTAAFDDVKRIISTTPMLMFYDDDKDTAVCADASGFGLGAVLMQTPDTVEEDSRPYDQTYSRRH